MGAQKGKEVIGRLRAMPGKKKVIAAGIAVLCIIIIIVYVATKKEPAPPLERVAVTAAKAVVRDMPMELREIGTIEGYRSVPLYAQVTGQLVKIHFKEGQDVKKGQPLFTLDPNQYQAKVRQAEARLAQDTAQMKFSRDEAKRYKYLYEKGAVSLSDYENKQSIADAQESLVIADKASLQDARLSLAYCFISAPFDGRMGAYAVFEGRMIKDVDTQLATINQITPVYAAFSLPEKDLPAVRKYSAEGKLKARAIVTGYTGEPPEGELTFMDNTVNTQTGMILLKATFPNTDRFLWPGQFVNVVLTLSTEKDTVVVPERAIQLGQTGKYAFVVKADNTVEYRVVTTDRTVQGLTVVRKGISAGETVVTDGHFKLRNGFPVSIRDSLASGQGGNGGGPRPVPAKPAPQKADAKAPETEASPAGK
ncbi:MAG: efflux RND transporter periplasmic adaptor subunit [Syntrophorhabdaceae bacterium]|nr:efflux RND transporter periplasmic adaptor subunit [Syntrophorhabdaceae bacterium]